MHKSDKTVFLDSNLERVDEGSPYIAYTLVAEGQNLPNAIARRYGLLKGGGEAASDQELHEYIRPQIGQIHGQGPLQKAEPVADTGSGPDEGALHSGGPVL